ncbi:hypothetical protein C8R42DRAFT_360272 [Lentinula raphanica]|nr:hypothetical protein C8R42DRAFT_360272 [Lentinula raphanica]
MFSFFSRKSAQEPASKSIEESLAQNEQLRTPSPSVDSALGKNAQNLSPGAQEIIHGPPITPSPPPSGPLHTDLGLIEDPTALYSLISSVPPKTVHEYLLAHLIPPTRNSTKSNAANTPTIHPPSSLTLTHLTSFFSTLTPPAQLHCVRCHKFYYEVENVERSCLVPHDDDSAEVEWVGTSRGTGSDYETLYNCCGKTVEGEGDMGPPDGWCYEGKHTTDTKRARFRSDSTLHDDKLTSCERLKCFEPPPSDDTSESESSSRRPRKRKRSTRKREEAETAVEDVAMDDGNGRIDDKVVDSDARSLESSRSKPRQMKKLKTSTSSPSRPYVGLPSTSKSAIKAASTAVSTPTPNVSAPLPGDSASASASTSKPRKKRAKTKHDDKSFKPDASPFDSDEDDMDVDDSASASAGPRKAKRATKNIKAAMKQKGKAKDNSGDTPSSKTNVEFPTGSDNRSSPSRQNQPESASGDEGRQRRNSHRHNVSFAIDSNAGSSSSAKPKSTTGVSGKPRSSAARSRTQKREEGVASSGDGDL